jgi:hypothetical protein
MASDELTVITDMLRGARPGVDTPLADQRSGIDLLGSTVIAPPGTELEEVRPRRSGRAGDTPRRR